ncbi:unnamed protein product, partial [Meganyctiphanes norvegica]
GLPRCVPKNKGRTNAWKEICGEQHTYEDTCNCEAINHHSYEVRVAACSGKGTSICGVCSCDEDYIGRHCECHKYTPWGMSTMKLSDCIHPYDPSQSVCSGRGTCVCGECKCDERSNPDERVDGTYCQCTNFLCPRYNGLLCYGPDRGKCVCNECECAPGWSGPACEIDDREENCINPDNGLMCSDYGTCVGNKCQCYQSVEGRYSGKWCEDCPTCLAGCLEYKDCVMCLAFNTGPISQDACQRQCTSIMLFQEDNPSYEVGESEVMCRFYDEEDCAFSFVYSTVFPNSIYVPNRRECPQDQAGTGHEHIGSDASKSMVPDPEEFVYSFSNAWDVVSTFYRVVMNEFDNTIGQFFKDMSNNMNE